MNSDDLQRTIEDFRLDFDGLSEVVNGLNKIESNMQTALSELQNFELSINQKN